MSEALTICVRIFHKIKKISIAGNHKSSFRSNREIDIMSIVRVAFI